jgi:hypothetical protein
LLDPSRSASGANPLSHVASTDRPVLGRDVLSREMARLRVMFLA